MALLRQRRRRSTGNLAAMILEALRQTSIVTISWPELCRLTGRTSVSNEYIDTMAEKLRPRGILTVKGTVVVAFVVDHDAYPLKHRQGETNES